MVGVEVVCCSPADCAEAESAGATRIELCGAILAGGLTPSIGLFEACQRATSLPIMVMIRPREGGFLYDEGEFSQMFTDISAYKERGAHGVVFGILSPDGSLDQDRMRRLRDHASGLQAMCHRAFDVVPQPLADLSFLEQAGFDRVLSSGQETDIRQGMPLLRSMFDHARRFRLKIQPCEHIRADNVAEVLESLRPESVHLGPFCDTTDPTSNLGRPVNYGSHKKLDGQAVREVVAIARG